MRHIYYFMTDEILKVGELVFVENNGYLKKATASDICRALFYVLKEREMMIYQKGDTVPVTPLINGEVYSCGKI